MKSAIRGLTVFSARWRTTDRKETSQFTQEIFFETQTKRSRKSIEVFWNCRVFRDESNISGFSGFSVKERQISYYQSRDGSEQFYKDKQIRMLVLEGRWSGLMFCYKRGERNLSISGFWFWHSDSIFASNVVVTSKIQRGGWCASLSILMSENWILTSSVAAG
jgi:hypothetical protein